ncbi:MAG: MOSC domain-containing protein [Dehalococcoidia bacterium]|nr:MOSC domain-containing protein [Dehalococcoidia bacterium]
MRNVAAIFTSPVKSLALNQPQSVAVGYSGIVEDRRFHLVDAEGRLLTQRQHGKLVQVQSQYSAVAETLTLSFPGDQRVDGPTELGDPVITVIWGRRVSGREVNGPWNDALSNFCGSTVRLVKTDSSGESFDEYPVSILSQASLEYLGARVNDRMTFEGRRFRPTFLLEGCSPHEEDTWLGAVLKIGPDLRINLVSPDPRCAITTLDPNTGERDFDVPKLVLSYRPSSRAAYFGVYGAVESAGTVSLGDEVDLVRDPVC